MRKRCRVLILAALVAAFVVPVGFALSLEAPPPEARTSPTSLVSVTMVQPVADSTKLLAVGTLLIGLAAFVRKAV
jgi:hypothetical protein